MSNLLKLSLQAIEAYDEDKNEYLTFGGMEIELEYSLYTISLWESKWKKPFMDSFKSFTQSDMVEFYKVMCVTPEVPDSAWGCITSADRKAILAYITDPMSATTVHRWGNENQPRSKKVTTTEQIYFAMASYGIPFECEHWHFNRLMKLLDVARISTSKPKKMSPMEAAKLQQEVFARNRAKYNSRG